MKTILFLLISLSAFAGYEHSPPPFQVAGGKAIFVDFTSATYNLTYDKKSEKAWATTHISFFAYKTGFPIFDSLNKPSEVLVDGMPVEHGYSPVPGNVTFVRYAQDRVEPGMHTMTIRTPITNGVKYNWRGVSSGFFIKDLTDRKFLERFVVSNYEFDQYQMTFNVKVVGTKKAHNVYANGEVTEISKNHIQIVYPEYFTASSLYFHLIPKSKFRRIKFNYTSINGRKFPVRIYSKFRFRNWRIAKRTIKVLKELERDYGPYPHPSLVIYGTKLKGGMEYVGATATSLISLGHELQHMWFAKGIMPANGNSGWIDEGLASWRDKGHKTLTRPNYFSWNLGAHNIYTRKTDKNSYEKGRSFFGYMNYKLKQAGLPGLKDFLKGYFKKRVFTTVTTQDFKSDLEEYSGLDLTEDFDKYIFGNRNEAKRTGRSPAVEPENPHHIEYSDKELRSIL